MLAIVELLLHLLGEPRPLHRLGGPLDRDVLLALGLALVDLYYLAPARARSTLVLADTSSELTLVLGGLDNVAGLVAWIRHALVADLAALECVIVPRAVMPVGGVGPVHVDTVACGGAGWRELGNCAKCRCVRNITYPWVF